MIPSLILIKYLGKNQVILTCKRNLTLGTRVDSDFIVNHPLFYDHDKVLCQIDPGEDNILIKKGVFFYLFYKCIFILDGMKILLIRPQKAFYMLILILIGTACLFVPATKFGFFISSQDWAPISLPSKKVYGNCLQDKNHPHGVRFQFDARVEQTYLLTFYAGGTGDGSSLKVLLNGSKIDKLIILPEGWGDEITLKLPTSQIIKGSNIIEFNPIHSSEKPTSWGLSDVKVLPLGKSLPDKDPILDYDLVNIVNTLKNQDLSGYELALVYETLKMQISTNPVEKNPSKEMDMLAFVEQRMEKLLYQVAFDIRSRELQGDHMSVQNLISDTRRWIPGSWKRGREIYNELLN